MSNIRTVVFAVIAIGAATSLACAAEQPAVVSPAQSAANEDFGMLSKQGAVAFRDVHLARLAIFDGQIGKAKQFTSAADTAFGKANNDAAAYTKAESDLTPPPGVTQPKDEDGDTSLSGPVKWLPVDGAMAVDEDYDAVPAKKAGVAKADAQIKSGDKKGALETLRLAGINVTFDMEVIPLDRSISKAQEAATLLNGGHYYEANQTLKSLENGARFDVASYNGTPKSATNTTTATGSGTAAQPAMQKGG